MIPTLLTIDEIHSCSFIQEFRKGERHLVCLAAYSLTLLDVYVGGNILPSEDIKHTCKQASEEGIVKTFYKSHGITMSLLPLLHSYQDDGIGTMFYRDDYNNRKIISKYIKQVFQLNREVVRSPKLSFLFEPNRFNNEIGVEMVYHHATSLSTAKDRILTEVSYIDTGKIVFNNSSMSGSQITGDMIL